MKYRVKLYWEMCAEVEVEAPNKKAAIQAAIDGPLPSCDIQEYVPDSANADPMDVVRIKEPEQLAHPIITQPKLDGWQPPNRDNW